MKAILRMPILLFMFTLSWTNAFALTPTLPVYIILLMLISLLGGAYLLSQSIIKKAFEQEDNFIFLFLLFVFISSAMNPNSKSLNYLITYIIVFLFCIILLPQIFKNLSKLDLRKYNFYGFVGISLILILEFILNNIVKTPIFNLIPGYNGMQAYFALPGNLLYRNYGFAEEPGYIAFHFVTLGPLAYTYASKTSHAAWYKFLFACGFLTLFSAGGIAFFIIAGTLVYVIKSIHTQKFNILAAIFGIGLIISLIFVLKGNPVFDAIANKVLLSDDSGSANTRKNLWSRDMNEFLNHNFFFGKGLGQTSIEGNVSSNNWYLFLANEAGIFPILTILIYFALKLIRIIRHCRIQREYSLLLGYLAGLGYFLIISTIQMLSLWILIAIFTTEYTQNYTQQTE